MLVHILFFILLVVVGWFILVPYALHRRYPWPAGTYPSLPFGDFKRIESDPCGFWLLPAFRNHDVVRIWMGITPFLMFRNGAKYGQWCQDAHHDFCPKGHMGFGYIFDELLGQCMGLMAGTRHKEYRSKYEPILKNTQATEAIVAQNVHRWFSTQIPRGEPVDVTTSLWQLALNVFTDILFLTLNPAQYVEIHRLNDEFKWLNALGMKNTWVRFEFTTPRHVKHRLQAFKRDWHTFLQTFKNGANAVQQQSLAFRLYTEEQAFDQTMSEMLFANLDIMVSSAAWVVYELTQHRLHNKAEVERDVIKKFVSECARLHPISAISVPELCLKSYHGIPANIRVVTDMFAINHDPHLFPNPNQFVLDRPNREKYMQRFGLNVRRMCPGRFQADMILTEIASTLLTHCTHIDLISPENPPCLKADTMFVMPDMLIRFS